MSATTEDAFLGGRLRIRQPAEGYRAGVDPVLLAASVPARPGETVLELGTGSGVALLCLLSRVPGLIGTGVERNPEMADLASKNAAANGLEARIVQADITNLPLALRETSFDHVIANPPFFDRSRGSAAKTGTREDGRGEETPVSIWVDVAIRRLNARGRLSCHPLMNVSAILPFSRFCRARGDLPSCSYCKQKRALGVHSGYCRPLCFTPARPMWLTATTIRSRPRPSCVTAPLLISGGS